jgi:5-formyltetrahydrofolate cyclo-ligase
VNHKQEHRSTATQAIAALSEDITHMPFWDNATTVYGYVALDDEVDLQAVFRTAVRAGKAIALPRIESGSRAMSFRRVGDFPATLERHEYGFLQPAAGEPEVRPEAGDLVLVPGRVFDRRGYRVGRGGGFYDRFLADLSDGVVTAGVGYGVQLVHQVPTDRTDIPVQIVVTDSETCFCRRSQ